MQESRLRMPKWKVLIVTAVMVLLAILHYLVLTQTEIQSYLPSSTASRGILKQHDGEELKNAGFLSEERWQQGVSSLPPNALNSERKNNIRNVTVTMLKHRQDRMGSRMQRPWMLWAMAEYAHWSLCLPAPSGGTSSSTDTLFPFPRCSPDIKRKKFRSPTELGNRTGLFQLSPKHDTKLYEWVRNQEQTKPDSILSPRLRQLWFQRILTAATISPVIVTTKHQQQGEELFWNPSFNEHHHGAVFPATTNQEDDIIRVSNAAHSTMTTVRSIHVAVHIRRGDVTRDGDHRYAYVSDEFYIGLLQTLHDFFEVRQRRCTSKTATTDVQQLKLDIHIFSEDYGDVNWQMYRDFFPQQVQFHLAPKPSNQESSHISNERNLRDWKHFLMADVLVVGGTFSRIPSYAREPPDLQTVFSLPLTIWATQHGPNEYLQHHSIVKAVHVATSEADSDVSILTGGNKTAPDFASKIFLQNLPDSCH